ncbi:MAG TPA: DUF2997 domain-containing protein [Planctomycetaceae bacterium]|nr:DUF2997 domain-containing protein [Planctomycetaceae bacterium]
MPVIDVTVSPQGETTIETHGFVGGECQPATQALEAALGLVRSEQLNTEFYQTIPHATPHIRLPDAE